MKLSIITVNYNNVDGLHKTIESVINQKFTNYEYIIIDGGSNDGSKKLIEGYTDRLTYWVSEEDAGIYNAMNKGIKQAKGDYCFFLNSGDWLIDEKVLGSFMEKTDNKDYLYGNVMTDRGIITYNEKITFSDLLYGTICHQAVFIKTKLFHKYGFYNESLTIVADWEFFFKTIIISNCSYKYINETICKYDETGISSNPKFKNELKNQREKILKSIYPMREEDYMEVVEEKKELQFYRDSRLIQLMKKIQQSNLYKKIR